MSSDEMSSHSIFRQSRISDTTQWDVCKLAAKFHWKCCCWQLQRRQPSCNTHMCHKISRRISTAFSLL